MAAVGFNDTSDDITLPTENQKNSENKALRVTTGVKDFPSKVKSALPPL